MPPAPLLERRFLIVSGKGGVGRTTVAAALARAAAGVGRRVLLAQMDAPERLGRLLGAPTSVGPRVTSVGDRLDAVNMTAKSAIHEYALMVLHYESLYRAIFENKPMRGFLAAVPGLDAYAMLGKAWWHTTERERDGGGRLRYDLVILDGPASGHATTMLKIPGAILEAMPKGPLARDAAAMRELFQDAARAAMLIVTLPEELPARETVALARTARETLAMPLAPLVVNGLPPDHLGDPAAAAVLERLAPTAADGPLADTLAGAALLAGRRRAAEQVLASLRRDPGLPIIELPRLPTTDVGPAEIDELADTLARQLG